MKHHYLVIVPPKGTRLPLMRIRVSLIVVLGVCAVAGFVGYFIPIDTLSVDAVEQNQRRSLVNQNTMLLRRVRALRESVDTLSSMTAALQSRASQVQALTQFDTTQPVKLRPKPRTTPAAQAQADVAQVTAHCVSLASVIAALQQDSLLFSEIPVVRPIVGDALLSTRFGQARSPFTGRMVYHYGLDIVAPKGTPVIATAAGTVVSVQQDPQWGLRVRIRHAYGFTTVYAHLGSARVGSGRSVKKGEEIGTVGMSGVSTGPHVHYETLQGETPINPEVLFFPDLDEAARLALADERGSSARTRFQ